MLAIVRQMSAREKDDWSVIHKGRFHHGLIGLLLSNGFCDVFSWLGKVIEALEENIAHALEMRAQELQAKEQTGRLGDQDYGQNEGKIGESDEEHYNAQNMGDIDQNEEPVDGCSLDVNIHIQKEPTVSTEEDAAVVPSNAHKSPCGNTGDSKENSARNEECVTALEQKNYSSTIKSLPLLATGKDAVIEEGIFSTNEIVLKWKQGISESNNDSTYVQFGKHGRGGI